MTNSSRRRFLKRGLNSMAAMTTAGSLGLHLGLSSNVLAQSSQRFSDYKALVCVFLYGGNDSFNMLVPTEDSDYQIYAGVRQNLAYPQDTLLPIQPLNSQPYALGMPASATSLQQLFSAEKLSFIANIGPLSQPLTKQMIMNDYSLLPPQLFSHNDQQSLWQSSTMDTASRSGWGGRMADLIADTNDPLSMNLTIAGTNLMQSGGVIQPFAVDAEGPEAMVALDPEQHWNSERLEIFERLMQQSSHPLVNSYAHKLNSAAENNARIIEALATVQESSVVYPSGNDLAQQLKMVASLIASQPVLGQSRQIYFVGLGGWDTHDAQAELHPQLLATLGDALLAFQQELDERQVSEQVTTFTMSEFGRTLTSNGDGTDHGWGGHQVVMGGAVQGGNIFGQLPELALGSDDDFEDGRMIPTLSIEQFGADLSRWFGLSANEIAAVFPNSDRFDLSRLGIFSV